MSGHAPHADASSAEASLRVRRSLADVALKSSGSILATYAGRSQDLAPWLADAEINRERHLRLQYMAGLAANTIHDGLGYRLTLRAPKDAAAAIELLRAEVLAGFAFSD